MKVAFVTPRYGPQVMGGAETAARQLAEHLVAETEWEAEAYSTCALDPHTWADELEPGDSEINGVPVHRFVGAHGRLPEFYGLDGRLVEGTDGGEPAASAPWDERPAGGGS